uniref:Uncharacterized protein n=1 Tax=Lotharella globosa TaxID=91324 RepID=A0A7S3Z4I7_9EUKA
MTLAFCATRSKYPGSAVRLSARHIVGSPNRDAVPCKHLFNGIAEGRAIDEESTSQHWYTCSRARRKIDALLYSSAPKSHSLETSYCQLLNERKLGTIHT